MSTSVTVKEKREKERTPPEGLQRPGSTGEKWAKGYPFTEPNQGIPPNQGGWEAFQCLVDFRLLGASGC